MTLESNFELQPELTGIALAYRNSKYIADEIFPNIPVDTKSFQYRKYDKSSFISVPDTRVGEKGSPNELSLKSKLLTETCENHAIKEKISQERIDDSAKSSRPVNLQAVVTAQITDVLKASRELSMAASISNTANYGDNYKVLSDKEKFSDSEFDAVTAIWNGLDKVIYKPNTLVASRRAMSLLRRNPYVVSACNSQDVKAGVAGYEALKELFEVDRILVGETIVNTKKNNIPVLSACWNNDIAFMHIDPSATAEYGITFGYKAEYETLQIGSYFDPDAGTKGCQILKGYQSYKDLFTCPECGYLFKNIQ